MRTFSAILISFVTIAVLSPSTSRAADGSVIACAGPGLLVNPAVPNPKTAKAIFLAVEKVLAPHRDVRRFPLVEYTDEGDHWTVFRDAPMRVSHTPVVLLVTEGGGQLEMNIAKCDGTISNAALSR